MEASNISLVNDSASLTERENHPTLDREGILFRQSFNWILVLSVPTLIAVGGLIFGMRDIMQVVLGVSPAASVGFGCMWTFGRWASWVWGPRCARHAFLAGLFGVAVFLIGVLSGSIANIVICDLVAGLRALCFSHWYPLWAAYPILSVRSIIHCIVLPVYLMGMFGAVPAFVLGVIGSFLFRRLLRTHQST
jgi:hypothetical protein